MSGKTARRERQAAKVQAPQPRRPTSQGRRASVSRGWLYGGLGAAALVAVVALVLASQLGGGSSEPPRAVSGDATAALLDGIPQEAASLGSPDAPVVLYEFADLQCPFCQRWSAEVLPTLVDEYVRAGDLRIVFQGVSFIGPDSDEAVRTAYAAGEQDRLWHVVDLLYAHQGPENSGWVTDDLTRAIGGAVEGLDTEQMLDDRGSNAVAEAVASAAGQWSGAGLNSTPSFLIGPADGPLERREAASDDPQAFRDAIAPLLGR